MRKYLSIKVLGVLCLASFLMATPQVFAADDFDLGGEPSESTDGNVGEAKTELEMINDICRRMCNEDEKFGKATLKESTKTRGKLIPVDYNETPKKPEDNPDPFRPIIKKEIINPVRKVPEVPVKTQPRDTKPAPPPPPPLKIFVKGIVGNEGSRLAIVEFEKEEMTIAKEQTVEGKFKVVDIYSDRVVVYSNKEQRRHTFKIGGDEKQ